MWAAVLPGVRVRSFHLEVMRADEGAAVVGLPEREGAEVAVLLTDPYSFQTDGFAAQANTALPGLAVVGGADRWRLGELTVPWSKVAPRGGSLAQRW